MKVYIAHIIWSDPYPKYHEMRINASSPATAAARALREWKKTVPRKKIPHITLKLTASV